MKKKQFVNYIHHSHTTTNEALDHHIRLLEPLAKMRKLIMFIDKPICKDDSCQQYCPIGQQVLRRPFVWLRVLYKRTHRQTSGRNAKRSSFMVNNRLHLIV